MTSSKSCFYEPAHSPLSPRRGARHEHTAVRAGARRAARAQLGLRRRVAECIPLRLRAGTCVWGGRGAVEVGVGCSLSHRPASRAALPPGTRARCPLAPRGGEPPLGRRSRRAHAAGRPGEASPTFAPHLSTGGAHRARASGTPPTPPTAGVRPPPRRRRPRRAPRDAPPPRRARTPRCTPVPTHMHTHTRVPRSRRGGVQGQRRRTSSACACFEGGAIPGAGD